MLAAAALLVSAALRLDDVTTLVNLSNVRVSPDGTRVAYTRSVADRRNDKFVSALYVVSVSGGAPRMLVAPNDSLGAPRWSPDGRSIAFVENDAKKTAQIFVIPATGGDARQLTHAKTDVEQFAWSPNGLRIAYVAANAQDKAPWSVHDDGYLSTYAPQPSHLWLVNADGSGQHRLTNGSWSVLEAAPPFVGAPSDPSWSPDGRRIAFTMQSDADDSDSDRTSAAVADVATGAVHRVTGRVQYEYQAAYTPEGRVEFLYPVGPGPISVMNVFDSRGNLIGGFDHDVTNFTALRSGLLLQASNGAYNRLYLNGKQLDTGNLDAGDYSASQNGVIAFVGSSSSRPPEIFVKRSPGAPPMQVTHDNARLAALQYGRSVEISWRAADGERSDGILTYPVNYQPGRKYPFVLRIHGGPESATTMGYDMLRQLFAARGYVVLQPNYRGSDNLGTAHEHAIYRDPGVGPGNDVIAGVRAVERMGIIDPKNETVTGHSYGGYMTGWMITHWHNWRSAVEGDAMLDWKKEYYLSAAGNLAWARDSLGGSPWDPRAAPLYASGSPITYVSNITTPTRIISGTADETVPAPESYELYHALHDRGIPVSFIAFPGMHHGPSKPSHIETYARVTLEWVDRYAR